MAFSSLADELANALDDIDHDHRLDPGLSGAGVEDIGGRSLADEFGGFDVDGDDVMPANATPPPAGIGRALYDSSSRGRPSTRQDQDDLYLTFNDPALSQHDHDQRHGRTDDDPVATTTHVHENRYSVKDQSMNTNDGDEKIDPEEMEFFGIKEAGDGSVPPDISSPFEAERSSGNAILRDHYLGPKIEKDWRLVIEECQDTVASLSSRLALVDKSKGLPLHPAQSETFQDDLLQVQAKNNPERVATDANQTLESESKPDLETLLQTHLLKMHDTERVREEQLREVLHLLRELDGHQWAEAVVLEGGDHDERMDTYLGMLLGSSEEQEMEIDGVRKGLNLGWTGDVSPEILSALDPQFTLDAPRDLVLSDTDARPQTNELHPDEIEDTQNLSFGSHTYSPSSPSDSHSPSPSPTNRHRHHHYRHHQMASQQRSPQRPIMLTANLITTLPRTVQLFQTETQSIINSLQALADTLSLTSSMAIATNRQFRGIRAGIENWKEREKEEEKAWITVGIWERERVVQGLKGVQVGVEGKLKDEMRDFEVVLDDWGRRLKGLMMGSVGGRRLVGSKG